MARCLLDSQLDHQDFADDLALSVHTNTIRWRKKDNSPGNYINRNSTQINLNKTELMKINITTKIPVTIGGRSTTEAESSIYLGNVVDSLDGTDSDIKSRIDKPKSVFYMLKNT